jgi:hypothetical protein
MIRIGGDSKDASASFTLSTEAYWAHRQDVAWTCTDVPFSSLFILKPSCKLFKQQQRYFFNIWLTFKTVNLFERFERTWCFHLQYELFHSASTWTKFTHPEDGRSAFLRNVRTNLLYYTVKETEEHNFNNIHFENMKNCFKNIVRSSLQYLPLTNKEFH